MLFLLGTTTGQSQNLMTRSNTTVLGSARHTVSLSRLCPKAATTLVYPRLPSSGTWHHVASAQLGKRLRHRRQSSSGSQSRLGLCGLARTNRAGQERESIQSIRVQPVYSPPLGYLHCCPFCSAVLKARGWQHATLVRPHHLLYNSMHLVRDPGFSFPTIERHSRVGKKRKKKQTETGMGRYKGVGGA